jgi:surfactin family lipopeptide synthetase A
LVAYVVAKQPPGPSISELHRFLQAKLPNYMVPSAFVPLEALPLTPNGKVDRRALPAPDQARPALDDAFVAPRTPVEAVLAGVWADVLGLTQVGVHDNFFALGGHSLLATQVISRLRAAFQVELPLRTLFEEPTVARLALAITQNQGERKDGHMPITKRTHAGEAGQLLAQLEHLSDQEVDSLLSDMLTEQELTE